MGETGGPDCFINANQGDLTTRSMKCQIKRERGRERGKSLTMSLETTSKALITEPDGDSGGKEQKDGKN